MIIKSFRLILEGPSGSGKSAFIEELIHLWRVRTTWQEHYAFIKTMSNPHELLISVHTKSLPKVKTNDPGNSKSMG